MTLVAMGFCFDRSGAGPISPIATSYLIAVCDTLLSSDDATIQDGGICKVQKAGFLGPWLIGYTGNPELFLPLRAHLATRFREVAGNLDISEDQLVYTLRDVYSAYREEKIADHILKVNWHIGSVAELRGMEHTHPKTYKRLWSQVERFDLGIDICLGGFSQKGGAQLRGVFNPGRITENRAPVNPGVITIGSGFRHAESQLRAWYDKHGPLKEAVYYMLEAKIAADIDVPSVGVHTDLIIVANIPNAEPKVTTYRVARENVQKFREAWIAERRSPSKSLIKLLDIEPLWNF